MKLHKMEEKINKRIKEIEEEMYSIESFKTYLTNRDTEYIFKKNIIQRIAKLEVMLEKITHETE